MLNAKCERFDGVELLHVPGEGAVLAAWFLPWLVASPNQRMHSLSKHTYDPVGKPLEAVTHSPAQVSVASVNGSGSCTVNENVTLPPMIFPMLSFESSKGGASAAGAACVMAVSVAAMRRAAVRSILVVCVCVVKEGLPECIRFAVRSEVYYSSIKLLVESEMRGAVQPVVTSNTGESWCKE